MRLPYPKALLPLLAVAVGAIAAIAIGASSEPPASQSAVVPIPLVRIITVAPETVRLNVNTYGTVVPRTESELIPQVAGPVVWISTALVSGGFFEQGELLLRIDPRDYEASLESARAALERRRSERHRAEKQFARQSQLKGRDAASESVFDDADNDLRVAVASLREANAALGKAERDGERTELRAPFTGRVRSEQVDIGQYVTRGQSIARLYAIDFAEVRLPIRDDDIPFINLSLAQPGPETEVSEPEVLLSARFAGAEQQWTGRIVRTEGEIDPESRMIHAVARVENPYETVAGRPPLRPADFTRLVNGDGVVRIDYDLDRAVADADVVMALRIQKERMESGLLPNLREYARRWGLNSARLKRAKRDVLVMHPGPMNRGVEIDSDVADGPHSVILNQVTNGVAIRMAVLYLLAGGRQESAEAAKQGGEA